MGEPTPRVGVTVGKFNPPHLGHLHLITTGSAAVDRLHVLLADRPDQTIPAADRAAWLADAVPENVSVIVTPDDLPEANAPWAARALEVLPERPTLAVTSEAWGPGWAEAMGTDHLLVDLARTTHPVSGTQVRADLGGAFHLLVPAARAAMARRVVVVGAESTGKTTLTEALAAALSTVWVPEHGRWYWEGRRHVTDQAWSTDELRRVAAAQRRLEDDLARRACRGVVVADTDALVTATWHERYLGCADPELDKLAAATTPDLYLICGDEIDWIQDGTRESRDHRAAMQAAMAARAEASGTTVVSVTGTPEERVAAALAAVEPLTRFEPLV